MGKDKQLFFVYGTLKQGEGNNRCLGNAKFLGEFTTKPEYTLFDGGYPIVERGGSTAVKGELFYSENESSIQRVFDLEGCSSQIQHDKGNWYDFDKIDTPHGEAIIFVMNKGTSGRSQILNSGVWK